MADFVDTGDVIESLQQPKWSSQKGVLVIDCSPHATKQEQEAINDMLTLPGAENIVFMVITGPDWEVNTGVILDDFFCAEFSSKAIDNRDN